MKIRRFVKQLYSDLAICKFNISTVMNMRKDRKEKHNAIMILRKTIGKDVTKLSNIGYVLLADVLSHYIGVF